MHNGTGLRPIVDGIIVLDKRKDATSMDMVRLAKRITRVKKIGHAGTLDPIATGVLPLCFGQATRLMEFMVNGRKTYRAEFTLGMATDTYDAYGTETHRGHWRSVTQSDVESLLSRFVGTIQQKPPMYSALKYEGQRLYELARAGIEVEREARDVVVYDIALLDWSPPKLTLEVSCGRGFYMRTLAHDIGLSLGCYAYLTELERVRAGSFSLDDAVSTGEFEAAGSDDSWRGLLEPPDAALEGLQSFTVTSTAERHLRNGLPVTMPSAVYAEHMDAGRAYATSGAFIAIVRFNRGESTWHPEKVFNLPIPSAYAPYTQ